MFFNFSLNIKWLDRATGALAFDPVSLKLPHVEEAVFDKYFSRRLIESTLCGCFNTHRKLEFNNLTSRILAKNVTNLLELLF